MDKSQTFVLGIVAGIVAVAIVFRIIFWRKKKKGEGSQCRYDERQIAARGKAYKAGFFATLIYMSVYGVLSVLNVQWCTAPVGVFLGCFFGIGVFICECIFSDAYFAVNQKPRVYLVLFTVVAVMQLINGAAAIKRGDIVENGLLTVESLSLACGVLFVVVLVAVAMKSAQIKREEQE